MVFGQTHERSVELINDVVCVNPGTVTGAFSPLKSYFYFCICVVILCRDAIPSFICLSLLPKTITVFSYILENGELSVKKDVFPQ